MDNITTDYDYWKMRAMASGMRFRTPEEIEQAEREKAEKLQRLQEQLAEIYQTKDPRYKEVFKRTCPGCGTVFYTQNPYRKYDDYNKCSPHVHRQNAKDARRKARLSKCTVCGKMFYPARSGALYCGAACKQKAYRQRVTVNQSGHSDHTQQP